MTTIKQKSWPQLSKVTDLSVTCALRLCLGKIKINKASKTIGGYKTPGFLAKYFKDKQNKKINTHSSIRF